MGTSVRKMYDAELLQLDTMLARMGHAAGGAIESAMTALRTGDTELARSVIARDSEIDSAEHEIEHRCLTLFLRQQPVAGDLRKVSTALKMVTDIERIADQASDIAEITLHLHPDGARTVGVLDDLYAMGDIALHMVKDAIAAYVQVDLSTAAQVIARDDDCDAMFSRISKEIAAYIAAHPGDAETALDLFMIDKYLERLGDHLRQFLYAVRAPWQTDGVQTDFVHALRLVDGIYPAAAITPYRDLTAALRADDLLQVKAVRYETVTRELPFETQTIEDAGLDFGKTETVQAGQNGSELVTSEITTVAGEVVSTRVVDVQLVQAAVPEVIHRGTRLKSGMIGRLGTGSFLWPVPGYSGISRWASLPYGHRGVDITAPYGTPIYAADAGTVIAAQWHNHPTMSWGYYVEIDHGNGYKTLYAHMSSFVVQAGQTVEKGQLIGYVGATGAATGPHCHFEMYYNNALISARNVFPDM